MNTENLPAVISESAKAQGLVLSNLNVILPTDSFGQVLGQYDKVTIETVSVHAGDPQETYEPNGTGKGYAFSKTILQKFASALSIQWHPEFTSIVESTATRSRAKAVGVMRKPNGEKIIQTEEKTIDLTVEEDDLREKAEKNAKGGKVVRWDNKRPIKEAWKDDAERVSWIEDEVKKGLKQKRKFKDELAMTGAKDRVIRAFLALKSTYTAEELEKPLAFPRVILDTNKMLDDPRVRQAAIGLIGQATTDLYGKAPEADPVVPLALNSPAGAQEPERTVGPNSPEHSKEIDFGNLDDVDVKTPEPSEREKIILSLEEYIASGILTEQQQAVIKRVIENKDLPIDAEGDAKSLRFYLNLCKAQEAAQQGEAS